MKESRIWAILFFFFALKEAVTAMAMLHHEHGNPYLTIAFAFVSVMFLLLAACYLISPDARNTIVWLGVITGIVVLIAGIAEWMLFTQTTNV